MEMSAEELTVLATLIANQLASGLDKKELCVLRALVSQVSMSLNNLYAIQEHCPKKPFRPF